MNINEQNQPIDTSQLSVANNEYFDDGQEQYGSVILHSLDQALKQEKLHSIPYTRNEDGSFKKIRIPVEGGYAAVTSDGRVISTFDPATLKDPTENIDVYYIVYYSLVGQTTANLSNETQEIKLEHFYSVSTSGDEMWPATFGPMTLTNNLNQTFGKNASIWVEGNYIDTGRNSVKMVAQKIDESDKPVPETNIGTYTLTSKGAHRGATVSFELTDPTYNGPVAPAYVILSDSNFGYIGFVRFQPKIIYGKVSSPVTIGWQGKEQHGKISIKNNFPVITQEDNPITDPFYQRTSLESKIKQKKPSNIGVKDIKFWVNGSATGAQTMDAILNNEKIGVYRLDRRNNEIIFQPSGTFVGRPQPIQFIAYGTDGHSYLGNFSQAVLGIQLQNTHAIQGVAQTSQITIVSSPNEPGRPLDPNSPIDIISNGQASKQANATKNGQTVGSFQIDESSGTVSFIPDKNFIGQPDKATIRVMSASGEPTILQYQPTVDAVRPSAKIAPTIGEQGQSQTSKVRITSGSDQVMARIDANHPARFIINGQVSNAEKLTITGIGSYILEPTTGLVTFSPDFEYFGKPKGVNIQVTDDNNTPAVATYNVTVLRHQAVQQPSPTVNSGDQGVIEESPAGTIVVQQPANQQAQSTTAPQSQEVVVQSAPQEQQQPVNGQPQPSNNPQEVIVQENVQQPVQHSSVQSQVEVQQTQTTPSSPVEVVQENSQPTTAQQQPEPTTQQPGKEAQQPQEEAEQQTISDAELPMIDDTNAWYLIAIALLGALSGNEE
ncbi:hypothetical protein [Limosilactobacillus agrestimuris]|uniref:hypothetical protein n=1 Tax=Limosilactobacillus agrestimuris TaxID=2941331 RepID=UPI00203D14C6|nr:hypothetical protein [Limosilactobacillus agrestimuris]